MSSSIPLGVKWRCREITEIRKQPDRKSDIESVAPIGSILLQAGRTRIVEGCLIRVPVFPHGWVDADCLEDHDGDMQGCPSREAGVKQLNRTSTTSRLSAPLDEFGVANANTPARPSNVDAKAGPTQACKQRRSKSCSKLPHADWPGAGHADQNSARQTHRGSDRSSAWGDDQTWSRQDKWQRDKENWWQADGAKPQYKAEWDSSSLWWEARASWKSEGWGEPLAEWDSKAAKGKTMGKHCETHPVEVDNEARDERGGGSATKALSQRRSQQETSPQLGAILSSSTPTKRRTSQRAHSTKKCWKPKAKSAAATAQCFDMDADSGVVTESEEGTPRARRCSSIGSQYGEDWANMHVECGDGKTGASAASSA